MTVSPPEVASLIDLDRYPIHDLDGAHTRALTALWREQFKRTGACNLQGFVTPPEALVRLERDAGTLTLFRGGRSMHGVLPVRGRRKRITAILTYDPDSNLVASDEVNYRSTARGSSASLRRDAGPGSANALATARPLLETSRTVSRTLSVVPHGAPCHRDMLRDPQKPEVQP